MDKLNNYCEKWDLREAELLTQTPRSFIYKTQYESRTAILKLYKSLGTEEGNGTELLKLCPSNIAARAYANDDEAALLEYLPGSDLRKLVENDRDDEATKIIGQIAVKLHALPMPKPEPDFYHLREWFESLFKAGKNIKYDGYPCINAAAQMADDLLSDMKEPCLLHGDIHHENIIFNADGIPKFIDPKGLIGDPAYDFANTMCNPYIPGIVTKERILRQSGILSNITGIDQEKILAFGFVHSAISYVWAQEDNEDEGTTMDIIDIFYEIVN